MSQMNPQVEVICPQHCTLSLTSLHSRSVPLRRTSSLVYLLRTYTTYMLEHFRFSLNFRWLNENFARDWTKIWKPSDRLLFLIRMFTCTYM